MDSFCTNPGCQVYLPAYNGQLCPRCGWAVAPTSAASRPAAYGPGAYGSNAYGSNAYGPGAYGLNAYGLGAYGSNAYGSNAYGSNAYGPNAYGPGAFSSNMGGPLLREGQNHTGTPSAENNEIPTFGQPSSRMVAATDPWNQRPPEVQFPNVSADLISAFNMGLRTAQSRNRHQKAKQHDKDKLKHKKPGSLEAEKRDPRKDEKPDPKRKVASGPREGWCLHCHEPGHYHEQCAHAGQTPPPPKRMPPTSIWEKYRSPGEGATVPPVPQTFVHAMIVFDQIYQHALDFDGYIQSRDAALLIVQHYLANHLDDDTMAVWLKTMASCNSHTSGLLANVRRLTARFFDEGIYSYIKTHMDQDPMGLEPTGKPKGEDKLRSWSRTDAVAYIHGLQSDGRNLTFREPIFKAYAGELRKEIRKYANRRKITADALNTLASNVPAEGLNGQSAVALKTSLLTPLKFMPTPPAAIESETQIGIDLFKIPDCGDFFDAWLSLTAP